MARASVSPQVIAKPSQPQKGNWALVEVKVKFIQLELIAELAHGCGQLSQQRAGGREGVWGSMGQERVQGYYGRGGSPTMLSPTSASREREQG